MLRAWTIPVLAIIVSWVATRIARRLILAIHAQSAAAQVFRSLSPTLSKFVWVVGLRIAIDSAPLPPTVSKWFDHGLYLLVVILVLNTVKKIAYLAIDWGTIRSSAPQAMQHEFVPILRNVITIFLFTSGVIMVLKHFDYDVLSLLTALGVGSFAVGLASKETLANMISGFTLVLDRNLRAGDSVNLGGVIGEVDEIGLRSTRVHTRDGNTLIVPNSELANTRILNLSSPSAEVSCSTQLRFGLDVPFEKIKAICAGAMSTIPAIQKDRGQSVQITSLADGHQLVVLGFWVAKPAEQGPALSDLHALLVRKLQAEQITLISPRPAP